MWVDDITYIPTQKGTFYLVVFVDMYSRKMIGWSMSTRMKDSLVIDAFLQGYKKEHPKVGLIILSIQAVIFKRHSKSMVLFRALVEKETCMTMHWWNGFTIL
ncbi:DDE-type integrase/transposase/recombinase [Bacillus cereus]|uniref:DDE-type integrase/transposase/recombinase n=1 Tax=Bacillus cereus TaxID=1396 RepID=UPI003D34807B